MPNWLAEPPPSLYVVLLIATIIPLFAAFFLRLPAPKRGEKQKKPATKTILAAISAVAILLLFALYTCDRMFESDREQIIRKMNEMSDGVRERNLNRVFNNVSESFRYGTANKSQLRQAAEHAQQIGTVDELATWDLNLGEVNKEDAKATIEFRFKIKGNAMGENQFLCRGHFVRDPDGQWRLAGFEVYPPTGFKDEYRVPGL
jgi:hypothetical protein